MAKRTTTPPAPTTEEINESLILLVEMLLSDYFFDPDNEQAYKQKLLSNRPVAAAGLLLDEETIEVLGADCDIRIDALRTWTQFRVKLSHPAFVVTVEGTWSFEKEELSQVKVERTGRARNHRGRRGHPDRGYRGRRTRRRGIQPNSWKASTTRTTTKSR